MPRGRLEIAAMTRRANPATRAFRMSLHDETTTAPAPARTSLAASLGAVVARLRRLGSLPWEWEARLRGIEMRGPVIFLGRPVLTLAPGSRIVLHGDNEFFSSPRCNAVGNARPCVIRTLFPARPSRSGAASGSAALRFAPPPRFSSAKERSSAPARWSSITTCTGPRATSAGPT